VSYIRIKLRVKDRKHFIATIGVACLFANTITLTYTFFSAYFHPSKSTTILINKLGEADIEAIMFPIVFILGLYSLYYMMKRRK